MKLIVSDTLLFQKESKRAPSYRLKLPIVAVTDLLDPVNTLTEFGA